MANNPTRRIPPATLQADLESFAALQAITDYAPANNTYAIAAITTARQNMEAKQTAETQAVAAYETARDAATDSEWEFHNAVTGAKTQVEAQYGSDSDQLQSLGRKKKSEYARPTRRQPAKTDPGQ
jgi:hypothetical protein